MQEGRVPNYATLAESGHISRARMSHLIMLNQLAPSIQEALLFLPLQFAGRDRITEKKLRPIAQHVDWSWQMKLFQDLLRES